MFLSLSADIFDKLPQVERFCFCLLFALAIPSQFSEFTEETVPVSDGNTMLG
jgi:hypothetical protein